MFCGWSGGINAWFCRRTSTGLPVFSASLMRIGCDCLIFAATNNDYAFPDLVTVRKSIFFYYQLICIMKKILLLALILGCMKVHAVTRTVIVNNGNWFTAATWSGNAVPVATDTVVVPVGLRVLANLGTTFMAPWNNPKAIFVRGTLEMTGNDPVFSNPITIDVFSGGTFYDHTDFAEFYMTPVSRIIVRLGANYQTGFYPNSNILNTSGGVPPNFAMPTPITPPFTITVNNGSFSYVGSVPLPLELTAFNAVKQGQQTKLYWQTANEQHTAYFEVERSADSKAFSAIGRVTAAGTGAHDYTITDAAPLPGNNLYRLKMTDADGSATYSNVVSVFFNAIGNSAVLYPNPAKDELYLSAAQEQTITIYNELGQAMLTKKIARDHTVLNIAALRNGTYYLNLDGQHLKFVKNK